MNNTRLTPLPTQRIWIGHWLMAVAALHTLFALFVFQRPLVNIMQRGFFNTVGQDPLTAATVWFVLFGALLALLALAITPLERRGDARSLRRLGWGVLVLSLLGLVLMPSSGFWLALPAGFAMLRRSSVRAIDSI
ncbi:DUF6463 family protein [Paucibacter sp. TC2R-5]|uniref:DUF6463 family protein n=1 Tax=Paucibacter sp. TC2R-5 TaxID=2893555 RepID=UPI0021E498E3|nr:DUF6463 family protein [Paucibacter sp. TC2R-5]MCV2360766.1 DUF6463 family protein [Paucibacter sp. TC2R-5]